MFLRMIYRHKSVIATGTGILVSIMVGCSPVPTASRSPITETSLPAVITTVQCEEELILPQIAEVQPARPAPGSEITVIGAGGYIRDTCGGYKEGSKNFELYLDQEPDPVTDFVCYVNHCEGTLILPDTISAGTHCLAVFEEIGPGASPDRCQFEFQVIAE